MTKFRKTKQYLKHCTGHIKKCNLENIISSSEKKKQEVKESKTVCWDTF